MPGFLNPNTSAGTPFISIKLSDVGRRMLSLGKLSFDSAVLSDREIDYNIVQPNDITYNISSNYILAPVDYQPFLYTNLDGSSAMTLSLTPGSVTSAKQFATAVTNVAGFMNFVASADTFSYDETKLLQGTNPTILNTISYSSQTFGGFSIILDNPTGSYFPNVGDLLYVSGWNPIQNSGNTYSSSSVIQSGNPTVGLFYRVSATTSPNIVYLDRPIPNFGNTSLSTQKINIYSYPYNGIYTYYGTAATVNPNVWNMSIVHTNSVEGTPTSAIISGYSSYSSILYNGALQYFGFSAQTIGLIHFSNQYIGNAYAEQLIEGSVELDIPNIMWHNNVAGNGIGYGLTLFDSAATTIFDPVAQTTYRYLQDGVTTGSTIVGRVYHKLKMFVITDPELLAAMTYKSNRNYTLPPLQLGLSSNPAFPLITSSSVSGLTQSGYTYYVTYIAESLSAYTSGVTFGYPAPLHCTNIQSIVGATDVNGNPQYLTASFPSNTYGGNPFPYLRNSVNMGANSPFSGTGWNANRVQILMNVQPNGLYLPGNVPANGWVRISSGSSGNGIYTGSTGDLTIDPSKLAGYQFVISQQDYNSGTTYVLNTALTINQEVLNFGDEAMFFGNVNVNILATAYKTLITVFAPNNSLNTSLNTSFDPELNTNTYITEIGILDNNQNLVAVGKPTSPIPKNLGRFLGFQLEMDF